MLDATQANADPKTIYLKDYQPPAWYVDTVDLHFELASHATQVTATLALRRNTDQPAAPLVLDCADLPLLAIEVDQATLDNSRYQLTATALNIDGLPDRCTLKTVTEIDPASNTSLMGLYQSSGNFCSQCEAEGFRKITFFPDRPDVLSVYSVTLVADEKKYPVLLSNGNPVATGQAEPASDGTTRHYAKWHDPHPKPCYLFALVAGNLACVSDRFTTASGRNVDLNIYVEPHNADQCEHAMRSVINAMRWDEQTYGREYDLDVFNIVAVDDFNMGAMENKGLNIFNSKYVLARADTATDSDYQAIEGVIGHEYFHNWSGNRVTCRDWFQLSLKEGFTVFRDQEFSADMSARGIKRIQDVNMLRTHQFREDAGPMAHPVRPDQYVEINNFYTLTVYEKGAEVVRMLYNLLGADKFRKGTDLYFARHDGEAVTTDDFVQALEDASGYDLQQFRLWYSTAGTPEITVHEDYNESTGEYTLDISQHTPDTPGQSGKQPLHIPLRMGLLSPDGTALELHPDRADNSDTENHADKECVLQLRQKSQSFVFTGIKKKPVASLLRGLSAPVKINMPYSMDELCFLMAKDPDEFNRWNAAQTLSSQLMLAQLKEDNTSVDERFIATFSETLNNKQLKPALVAEILRLPSEGYIADMQAAADPDKIHAVRNQFRQTIAASLHNELMTRYEQLSQNGDYRIEPDAMGERALKNLCLAYLMSPPRRSISDDVFSLCVKQFNDSINMTDSISALACLCNTDDPAREESLALFHDKWRTETLVLDKWFSLQATSELPGTLAHVVALTRHEAFSIKNPNKVRALIGAFASGNPYHFHQTSGKGYRFVADRIIELDGVNPQVAARLMGVFSRWRQYDETRQTLMKNEIQRILDNKNLSKDVYEIASKSIKE